MKMYGFKIIDAVRIPNYGGSIRVIASLNQKIQPSKNVKKILKFEKSNGFYTDKKYKKFSNDIVKNKKKIINLLLKLKKNKKRIVGIGCPGRCITLLAYCKINNKILDYIAEQNTSLKLNLYTPNSHLQVLDEKYFSKTLQNMH